MCEKAGGLAMDQFDQAPSAIRAQYPGALAMLTVMYDRVQAVCEVRTYMCVLACVLLDLVCACVCKWKGITIVCILLFKLSLLNRW